MAYNGFPASYQPMYYPQYQQPYQTPQYQQPVQSVQQPASRTVEVFPADNEKAAQEFPVSAGMTQIIIAKDDSFIAVKSVSMTGQVSFEIYDKRPPAPPEKQLDLTAYITREEFETRLATIKKPDKEAK